jgi:hypothetical protein
VVLRRQRGRQVFEGADAGAIERDGVLLRVSQDQFRRPVRREIVRDIDFGNPLVADMQAVAGAAAADRVGFVGGVDMDGAHAHLPRRLLRNGGTAEGEGGQDGGEERLVHGVAFLRFVVSEEKLIDCHQLNR